MHKRITFRAMPHSDAIEAHCNEQLKKIEEFLESEKTPRYIDLVLEPSKVHSHHRVELRVKSPNYNRVSNYEGSDFHDVLNRVIDVMYKELHEDKKKKLDHRKVTGRHEDAKKKK